MKYIGLLSVLALLVGCSFQQTAFEQFYDRSKLFNDARTPFIYHIGPKDKLASIYLQARRQERIDDGSTRILTLIEFNGMTLPPQPILIRDSIRQQLLVTLGENAECNKQPSCADLYALVQQDEKNSKLRGFATRSPHSIRGQQSLQCAPGLYSFKMLLFASQRLGRGDARIINVQDLRLEQDKYYVFYDLNENLLGNIGKLRVWIERQSDGSVVWEMDEGV